MKDIFESFDEYTKNYDFNIKGVNMKYHHTLRVADIAKKIAKSINLNEEDTELAVKCALLHDIARFKQTTEYNTFEDNISFDHGDMGETILRKNNYISTYEEDKYKQELIITTVRNHNKFKIEDNLDEKVVLFCKIVRDADKVDILNNQSLYKIDGICDINENIYNSIKKHELVNNKDVSNKVENDLRQIGFLFDLEFSESYKIINENNIVNNTFELLKKHTNSKYITEIEDIVTDYIRCKIDA